MVYDYWWVVPGFPYLPTPDQIAREYPNAAGWGTGMENCALSAAQVLPGALLRHELAPEGSTEHEARTLFQGLLRLFHAASDAVFLPRDLALDGVSHYPNSSADQYTMVLYALHAYAVGAIATAAERRDVRDIWQSVLVRWERDGWEDRRADGGPAMYGEMNRISPDRACRLLAALLGGFSVTGDGHWQDVYRQKLEEQDYARLRTGLPVAGGALYVLDQNQVAWRLLWELEQDPDIRQRYADLLSATAHSVLDRLPAYRRFDAHEHARLLAATNWDWNKGCVAPADGLNHGAEYNARLRQLAPVSAYEHEVMQSPWEAAHILALSEHAEHHRVLHQHLPLLLAACPWDELALSWSIYDVEWTYWTSLRILQGAEPMTTAEFIPLARDTGSDLVELRPDQVSPDSSDADVAELRQALDSTGIGVSMLVIGGSAPVDSWVPVARALGTINLRASGTVDELHDAAQSLPPDMRLVCQMHSGSGFENIILAAQSLARMPCDRFGLMPEPANAGRPTCSLRWAAASGAATRRASPSTHRVTRKW
jgi:hypothetical protein